MTEPEAPARPALAEPSAFLFFIGRGLGRAARQEDKVAAAHVAREAALDRDAAAEPRLLVGWRPAAPPPMMRTLPPRPPSLSSVEVPAPAAMVTLPPAELIGPSRQATCTSTPLCALPVPFCADRDADHAADAHRRGARGG